MQIIMYDIDEDSRAQILTGYVSQLAQCSHKIDAAQMSSASQPQCKTAGRIDETVSLTEKPGSRSGNYDVNSSVVSYSAAAIVELGIDVETHTATAAQQVAAESICPPAAINRDNLTMAAESGTDTDSYQSHGGMQKGVSDTREKTARGPEQVTVEPYGMESPQTVMINGDDSNIECSDKAKATEPHSRLRAMPHYALKILEMLSKDTTDAKCK